MAVPPGSREPLPLTLHSSGRRGLSDPGEPTIARSCRPGKGAAWLVIGEASDRLEALQMAVELRPDLILLDIGLPSLNGIEVARQMRSLVPESIIIFLTQESSADVVQEALSLGARGYVSKNMVPADLFAAVETVLSGMTFVSNS
jgi:DNA-binding NarL/FixJ family response regulator